MTATVTIRTRRATAQDAHAIRALIDAYVSDGTLLPRSQEFIASHAHHFIVAEENGGVVGCVHLDEYAPSLSELRSLAVARDGQGKGIGRALVLATEDSKKLAASTTDAARQITLVTQQQRSGTEQVLQSVREIAETLSQSVAAMAQTRSSAEQLKSQADKLSSLVRAFRIENA